jgi:hypothetical protein
MITHRDAAKWSAYEWVSKVSRVEASGDGAVGVLFVWANDVQPVGGDYSIATASFVVKPLAGSAVSTRFAEAVLTKVASVDSPDSIELARGAKGYNGVLAVVDEAITKGWIDSARARPFKSAGSFVLQRMMRGYREMAKDLKPGGGKDAIVRIITNLTLMKNMGKLGAADMIIGNGDRIEAMNMGNIMFNDDGTIAAIDSASILASFEQLIKVNDVREGTLGMNPHDQEAVRQAYVERIALGGVSAPTNLQLEHMKTTGPGRIKVATAPSASLQDAGVANVENGTLFENMKNILLNKIKNRVGTPNELTAPTETDWTNAKSHFLIGFKEGLAIIDNLLGGKAAFRRAFSSSKAWKTQEWRDLKKEFKKAGQDGADPNFSWHNLTIRREVYMALRDGQGIDDAITRGAKLAEVKEKKKATFAFFKGKRIL